MTGTTVITNRVRPILDDEYADGNATQRWTDAILLAWLNDGQRLVADLRPESLLSAAYTMTTYADLAAIGSTSVLPDRYQEALVDYVCARALNEDAQDERDLARADSHFKQFVIKSGIPSQINLVRGRGA